MPTSTQEMREERPLISNATILILSGFLIGLTVGKIVAEDLSPYVLACGLSGFLAFIALDLTAQRRAAAQVQIDQREVSQRLEKICPSRSSMSFELPPPPAGVDSLDEVLRLAERQTAAGSPR